MTFKGPFRPKLFHDSVILRVCVYINVCVYIYLHAKLKSKRLWSHPIAAIDVIQCCRNEMMPRGEKILTCSPAGWTKDGPWRMLFYSICLSHTADVLSMVVFYSSLLFFPVRFTQI